MPRIWELKEPALDENGNPLPFSRLNIRMAALSTAYACEEMGLTRGTPLTDAYHRTITHPDDMMKK
jgi:hypothetical protein